MRKSYKHINYYRNRIIKPAYSKMQKEDYSFLKKHYRNVLSPLEEKVRKGELLSVKEYQKTCQITKELDNLDRSEMLGIEKMIGKIRSANQTLASMKYEHGQKEEYRKIIKKWKDQSLSRKEREKLGSKIAKLSKRLYFLKHS